LDRGRRCGVNCSWIPRTVRPRDTIEGWTATVSRSTPGPNQFESVTAGPITYLHNALGISAETESGATTRYRRDADGGLHSERLSSGSIYYYTFDGLGSVAALTDSAGTAPTSYSYDPYGVTTPSGATNRNPWRYASGYQDSGSSFYKFGVRYYMPTLMRWTQAGSG
jgi:YD repeat-containing protein